MHALAKRPRADDDPATTTTTFTPSGSRHTPVIDSLIPGISITPSDRKPLTTAITAIVLALVGLCTIAAMIHFVVRHLMRRAAVKRRRQVSWILRSGQWNTEPKRDDAHETRSGYSDASSTFPAYPYPLSEDF